MPRHKTQHEETVPWIFNMPASLAYKVDLLLMNPLTGKVKYGARKQLAEKLFREWLERQIGKSPDEAGFEPDLSRYASDGGKEDISDS